MQSVWLVIPCYNEEEVLVDTAKALYEKANKLNITLFEDQFIHFGQIVGTWAILTL